VVIADPYPKAADHWLVLPKGREWADTSWRTLVEATDSGATTALLRDMLATLWTVLEEHVEGGQEGDGGESGSAVGSKRARSGKVDRVAAPKFILGFHLIPSLARLHLHCMSVEGIGAASGIRKREHLQNTVGRGFVPLQEVLAVLEGHQTVDELEASLPGHAIIDRDPTAAGTRYRYRCIGCDAVLASVRAWRDHRGAGCDGISVWRLAPFQVTWSPDRDSWCLLTSSSPTSG
jgi:hypothetical protein